MPEERIYVIPIRRVKRSGRKTRSKRASMVVREFLRRHMKSDRVKIDQKLNSRLWARGIQKPCLRIRVRAVKGDDGSVEAFLAE
ncbi:MAG: 50S ribosomal protein L31e [Candidatus Hadarchaeales archaeon]